jgi:phosphatidylglycerophosphatase A
MDARYFRLLATVGGTGLAPIAPGTVASVLAALAAWLILQVPAPYGRVCLAVAAAVAFVAGVWATKRFAAAEQTDDPGTAVIDEVAGQWIALLAASPSNAWHFAAGFLLFRFFDIAKPWPVNWAQRRFGGGWGIMLDDVVAGLAALAAFIAGWWIWNSIHVA